MNVLIISGHPDLSKSVVNRLILDEVRKALPEAEIRDLGKLYPDYKIDVAAEQAALLKADLIVWQFPYYWYHMPALMKKWLDDVFLHGFSHGRTAKLAGKKLLVSFTTGAPDAAYTGAEGSVGNISAFVTTFEGIARLCRLDYRGAMWLTGVSYASRSDSTAIAEQQAKAENYAGRLIARIREIEAA